MKKKARTEDADKLSMLSDDVIHHIMSFLDTRDAVKTSVLSKRWKFVWTSLPFLRFKGIVEHRLQDVSKVVYTSFINHVFSSRNHQCRILQLDLCPIYGLKLRPTKKFIKYAINHNVERLNVESENYCSLSVFNSDWLKQLKLTMKFKSEQDMISDCWTLPNLTTLICKCTNSNYSYQKRIYKLPESCLKCLPALTHLCLNQCDLPDFISLPSLTTLNLESCRLPKTVWDFPALSTLKLVHPKFFPKNSSQYFFALASLRNLTIDLYGCHTESFDISSSLLTNLKISSPLQTANQVKIVVKAPKLCNVKAVGFLLMEFEGLELETVDIKFWDCGMYKYDSKSQLWRMNPLFTSMFSQLGSTKILSLDLLTLQVPHI